ncbi:uncharacterized protein CANTADRAFT_43469 [Suhomyces tanzawaensis NRRL Y-17324]|uniref:12 kDa heat shock protein n=1 Tax=Suhomyces tanzawaensis NRRL Y-17324 TaxID=984487 RepID=A0A1E4SRX6_9ASCO|nr:uncharacterized protein CANTADRAFT_43469 [Suhomyces tanzawaensis NRRL Y-17324]ODV82258.1 hypothetical protein CANTADRAFT_43469 [Suhomyces tanzawaensis NRRL Y-17324]
MSDLGRKNLSDKITESVKPDSEKTTIEKAKEQVTSTVDDLARKATPEEQKSFSQTVADNVKEGHDDAKDAAQKNQATLVETASEYVDAAKEQVANAAQYVSSVVTGAKDGAETGHEAGKK